MKKLIKNSLLVTSILFILSICSCVRSPSSLVKYCSATLSDSYPSLEIAKGVTLTFDGPGTKYFTYGVQRLSESTVLVIFQDTDPAETFLEISHETFGLGTAQVIMVQPLLGEGMFLTADSSCEMFLTRNAFETVVKFTQLPYCLLISRADALYFAEHFPGKYLLEGDLLYYAGPNWIPSHSAIYLGVDREIAMTNSNFGFNDEETFAESYPYRTYGYNLIEEGVFAFPNNLDGSQYVDLFECDTYDSRWLDYWAASSTGPRRCASPITASQRRRIARYFYNAIDNGALWSVGLAWSGYRNIPFTKRDLYSCVGIVEKAYESAGANIVPLWDDWFYLNSFEQFSRTVPIPEITEYVGNKIEFRVNALLADWKYVGTDRWYLLDHAWVWGSTGDVELVDSVGTLSKKTDHCLYSWTPNEAGEYGVTFRFFGHFEGKLVEKSHTLKIKVLQNR